jgi:PAS domain S-box-containing protein
MPIMGSEEDKYHIRPRLEVLSDAILHQAIISSPDGLLICDATGTIWFANDALCSMLNYTSDQLVGQQVEMLVPHRERDTHVQRREGYIESPHSRPMGRGLTLSAVRSDGSEVAVEISLSPVVLPTGNMTIASIRDITDRLADAERLRATREMLTLSSERERIARDLHDTVLQRLFGLGLELQAMAMKQSSLPDSESSVARLETSVDEIDHIIKEIRTSVFTLGAARREGSLGQEIGDILAQSARVLGFSPRLRIEGPLEHMVSGALRVDLAASLREALGNVARHSQATVVSVELIVHNYTLTMRVIDNGLGLPQDAQSSPGNGLRNLSARATTHGGTCNLIPIASGGTLVEWIAPVV